MKFIFITDTHGMAKNPGSRLDNFPEALLKKIEFVVNYAGEIGASGIIHGGDWLHTPDVSESFIREFSKVLSKSKCPIFGVLGNHDIYGANPATFNRTAFGIAECLNLFNRLFIDKAYIIGDEVAITGQDSHYDLDKNGAISDYTESIKTENAVNIHIVHGMLVEREWPMVDCTVIENIKNCNADIILTGHEHTGFGVKTLVDDFGRKKFFCNPGSLARITASVGDVRKDVRMAVITVENGDFDVELVNLPSSVVSSANEVIDIEKLRAEKENKANLDNFLNKINQASVDESFNIYEALSSISEEIADNEVIDECRRQLEIAEEEI